MPSNCCFFNYNKNMSMRYIVFYVGIIEISFAILEFRTLFFYSKNADYKHYFAILKQFTSIVTQILKIYSSE